VREGEEEGVDLYVAPSPLVCDQRLMFLSMFGWSPGAGELLRGGPDDQDLPSAPEALPWIQGKREEPACGVHSDGVLLLLLLLLLMMMMMAVLTVVDPCQIVNLNSMYGVADGSPLLSAFCASQHAAEVSAFSAKAAHSASW
jgi:hypothetical protein